MNDDWPRCHCGRKLFLKMVEDKGYYVCACNTPEKPNTLATDTDVIIQAPPNEEID